MNVDGPKVRIGVSACLLGDRVRWDGGHKRDAFVAEALAAGAELVPVCPEVELGLGVPREPLELVDGPSGVRMVGRETGRDHTEAMASYAARRVAELEALGLSGYVFKSRSPSCGIRGVAVREGADQAGLFAARWIAENAALPVVDEEDLADATRRSEFLARVRGTRPNS
jgi:uncharacterized protein YbbK (DUF523 family)